MKPNPHRSRLRFEGFDLDPASGETKREFVLPVREGFEDPQSWGYIGVSEDTLVAGGQPVAGPGALRG